MKDMIDLTHYRDKLSDKAYQVISLALEESQKRQHYYLGIEHIFLSFTEVEKTLFDETMRRLNVDPEIVKGALKEHLSISKQYLGGGMKVPGETKALFQLAWERVQGLGRSVITSIDIFVSIFQEDNSLPVQIMRSFGVEPEQAMDEVVQQVKKREERERELRKKFELPPYLKQFGVNFNRLARLDKIPPIIGREKEIDHMIEFLSHRERPNSVMVVGEPGVGKTAIVEGLARRIELSPDSVPKRLADRQIVNLQMNSLVAGTMFRGMFEDRIEKIIKELRDKQNIILFIDEAHSLIGAGSAMGVPSDAANIFKSSLARGEIQIIGATTQSEYKEFIAEDEALARRFRVLTLREPSIPETREILKGLRPRLERNYGVDIADEAMETALTMSRRYSRAHRLPDKALGWLDTAAVRVEIRSPRGRVTSRDVLEVISQESGVPLDMGFRDTSERFVDMESSLTKRVVGQQEAVRALSQRLRLNKGPLKENFTRPDGTLLFLGPTGVGKTELARALAEFLYGSEDHLIRLDMSEYRDSSIAVDKLIGMPRGIVGSERGGILTNMVRERPSSVLLLDEIEKANHFVLNLFLQVFDEGWLTDGRGKKVYFSDCVIIMTSNLGSDEFKKFTQPLGFLQDGAGVGTVKKGIMKEVENTFTPEFINRIDDIIVFNPLSREEVKKISRMYLDTLRATLRAEGRGLRVKDAALEHLVDVGFSLKYGARFLKRTIDEKVKIPITLQWKDGNMFIVDAREGNLSIDCATVKGLPAPVPAAEEEALPDGAVLT